MKYTDHKNVRIAVSYDAAWDKLRLWIIKGSEDSDLQVARLTWEKTEPHSVSETTHDLNFDQAQDLMNALWDCGIRPAQAKGSAGQLEATRAHLEDMRTLVFKIHQCLVKQ